MPQPNAPDASTVRRYQENDDEAADLDVKKVQSDEQRDDALQQASPASNQTTCSEEDPAEPSGRH